MMDTPAIGNIEATLSEEIPSLLVPVADGKLLLPTVSVAEMLPYQAPRNPQSVSSSSERPGWYLGDMIWRGVMVPMISFEIINGDSMAAIQPNSQVAVLNSTEKFPQLPFLCFPTQGIPRLSRVTHDEISENKNVNKKAFYRMHVSVAGEQAIIPDVSGLEKTCIETLNL